MKLFSAFLFSIIINYSFGQSATKKTVIFSQKVKDSFEIYISTPPIMSAGKAYNVIYYCDANLKSGRKLRELISSNNYQTKTDNTIFVGIGHIGNFHVLRRRDFILPAITGTDTAGSSANYGQIENFYQFLKTELIPQINSKYKTNAENNTIEGHSLGGLFAFYCLFKNETIFKNYYALSPALWIDHYSIYHFNKLSAQNKDKKNLYFSAGGLEVMNHIKKGTNKMKEYLEQKSYPNLQFKYEVHGGKTHNSQVEGSIKEMLRNN